MHATKPLTARRAAAAARRRLAAGVGLLVAISCSARAIAAPPVVAVFAVEDKTKTILAADLQQLTDYLVVKVAEGGVFQVVPTSQLKARLTQLKARSYKQCYDSKCQIEIGRELAAQKSFSTQISRIGSRCVVMSVLYDLKRATSERSASKKSDCRKDDLVAALEHVVEALKARPKRDTQRAVAGTPPISGPKTTAAARPRALRTEWLAVELATGGALGAYDGYFGVGGGAQIVTLKWPYIFWTILDLAGGGGAGRWYFFGTSRGGLNLTFGSREQHGLRLGLGFGLAGQSSGEDLQFDTIGRLYLLTTAHYVYQTRGPLFFAFGARAYVSLTDNLSGLSGDTLVGAGGVQVVPLLSLAVGWLPR